MRHAVTTALLVEDKFEERNLIDAHLRTAGVVDRCEGTPALEEALSILRKQDRVFDVILLDLALADSTASNTVLKLPDLRAAAAGVPIVVITGNTSSKLVKGAMAHADGLVQKPYRSEELSNTVASAIRRNVVTPTINMPDHRSEIAELNREWRREMIDALKEVRVQIAHLTETLTKIREEFAKSGELQELEKRMDTLEREHEKDKAKLMGGYVVVQVIVAIGVWIAAHYWK